jgi:hypothetical protein
MKKDRQRISSEAPLYKIAAKILRLVEQFILLNLNLNAASIEM